MNREIQVSPQYLYKYMGNIDYLRQMLETNTLYMSSALEFNDPFDMNIKPNADIGDDRMAQYSGIIQATDSDIRRKLTPEQIAHFLKTKEYATPDGQSRLLQGAMNGVLSHGVFCLTTIECSLKFWSIYANNYSGVCLRFKPDYHVLPFKSSSDVKYGEHYPVVGIDEYDKFEGLFLYKHNDWQDESEWRIVLKRAAKQRVPFQPNELDSIICGFNMQPRDIDRIRGWVVLSPSAEIYRPKLFITKKKDGVLGLYYEEDKIY
jgi:hypothetical protein